MANSANTPTRPKRLLARERDRAALELRMQGLTFAAIGASMGITGEGARTAVMRSLEETKADIAERAEELRAMESQKLDAAAQALWPQVLAGNLRAQNVWLRNRERYARLLGLDLKPPTPESSGVTFIVNTALPWERPGHPDYRGDAVIDGETVPTPGLPSGEEDEQ